MKKTAALLGVTSPLLILGTYSPVSGTQRAHCARQHLAELLRRCSFEIELRVDATRAQPESERERVRIGSYALAETSTTRIETNSIPTAAC